MQPELNGCLEIGTRCLFSQKVYFGQLLWGSIGKKCLGSLISHWYHILGAEWFAQKFDEDFCHEPLKQHFQAIASALGFAKVGKYVSLFDRIIQIYLYQIYLHVYTKERAVRLMTEMNRYFSSRKIILVKSLQWMCKLSSLSRATHSFVSMHFRKVPMKRFEVVRNWKFLRRVSWICLLFVNVLARELMLMNITHTSSNHKQTKGLRKFIGSMHINF